MAVAVGRCSGNGAQQGVMPLWQGLPVGADDVQGNRGALGGIIVIALLGRGDDEQAGASMGTSLVEQLLRFARV